MNASDERKLESIGTKVKQFARTAPVPGTTFKVIFLDEADAHPGCAGCAQEDNGAKRPDVQVHPFLQLFIEDH